MTHTDISTIFDLRTISWVSLCLSCVTLFRAVGVNPDFWERDAVLCALSLAVGCITWLLHEQSHRDPCSEAKLSTTNSKSTVVDADSDDDMSVLPCIRNRRSVMPKGFMKDPPPLDDSVVRSLLDAGLWGPFHGRCYANQHPARFVVLGKESMVDMQKMTLEFYDRHWRETGWGSGTKGTEEEYLAWRKMTEGEIAGRWGPCSHMIGIVMRRQSGPRRLPEWEEAAAVAAAVQNMHIQSTQFPRLACYWSSWHDAARDSDDMKSFLGMEEEDRCMGFFIVAQVKRTLRDSRKRDRSLMAVEWRS
mmetsp:Transcript_20526/g.46576  ORF Transcript_20526/g.46576 Transcript_20526/m.46576 type:complete len:304 (-) Transcript_20526:226-1137(-)|eukprot:CAMPEP_0113317592 /NCGR_PEP_ID=MMETSP0010_2-20120614/12435_1 /TAXON_ID=216773 ORGANISM="Corethron hystrix, Strain 308" /NCGR_SAMPLE_ID=MMETSP0010_2 /ASSEMBLY_ACC=CAM_ASM_000155 /LENGTH=303 /DNA_ID=CAMNT_0000174597 /DNA_START=14 /DNA_END=925 /DNA_ORIENTATION=- /assembly_acc=CAM_ASM_000155